jgi:uncharacterized protein (UPF0335 family)
MTINELTQVAERLESLIRRTEMFGKSKNDILDEIFDMAQDMRGRADRLAADMERELFIERETILPY